MTKFQLQAKRLKNEDIGDIESRIKSNFTKLTRFFALRLHIRLKPKEGVSDNEYWHRLSNQRKLYLMKKYVYPFRDREFEIFKKNIKEILESVMKGAKDFQSLKEIKNILFDIMDEVDNPPPSTYVIEFSECREISNFGIEYINSKIRNFVQRHNIIKLVSKNFYKFDEEGSKSFFSLRFNISRDISLFHEAAEKLTFYLKLNKDILYNQKNRIIFNPEQDLFLSKKEKHNDITIGK